MPAPPTMATPCPDIAMCLQCAAKPLGMQQEEGFSSNGAETLQATLNLIM